MVDASWVAIGLSVLSTAAMAALSIDTWVHKRANQDTSLVRDIKDLREELGRINTKIDSVDKDLSTEAVNMSRELGNRVDGICREINGKIDSANSQISRMTGRWEVKVGQLDEHLVFNDTRITTLQVQMTSIMAQVARMEATLDDVRKQRGSR